MFPFGRLGAPKTTAASRLVAPPPRRVESPELVLMGEKETAAVVVSRKRRRKSVFLGVFPPKKGECSCGKRTTKVEAVKEVKEAIPEVSNAEEESEEEDDEVVVVPFSPSLPPAPASAQDADRSATEEDDDDDDYSPPTSPSRINYAEQDSEPEDSAPSPLERALSPVASTSSSDDDESAASLIQRALTIAADTMNTPLKRPLQATCHHDKTKSDRPKMLCATSNCNTQWCQRCIEKYYPETPFLLNGTFLCPLCRDICSCAACRRKRANGAVRPSAPKPKIIGARILPGRKGKEKEAEAEALMKMKRRASTVWDASDEEEYGEEEEESDGKYGAAGEEVVRVRRKRLGGSERRRSRRVSIPGGGGEKEGSTSAAARRRLPTRTTRRAVEVEKVVLEESLEMSMQEGEVESFPSFSKESWKAGLEGSDAELELEESSEEEEEMEVEEEPVKSMWSSAGGLFGDVGVVGGGGEPTLAFAPTTLEDGLALCPPLDEHSPAEMMVNHVLASLTAPPTMSLDPTPTPRLDGAVVNPQPPILAPVPQAPPSRQKRKNGVSWCEGPARRKRRLEGSLGGGAGGDSQSPMSDPQSPEAEAETGSHPPGMGRRTSSNGSNGSLGAPPPYSSRDELQAPTPQSVATSSSTPSASLHPHARASTAPANVDANVAPAFVWSPPPQPQAMPHPRPQYHQHHQHPQQQYHHSQQQHPQFPPQPPSRPASSLSNYDPRIPILGVSRPLSASTSVQQHHPRYSHPHPHPHPHQHPYQPQHHFPSPAPPQHDYTTSFTHLSSLASTPSTPSQSPQLLPPPLPPQTSTSTTATYCLPPTSLATTSDTELARFMRAAAGGGMHGAMALNAWSQSVFMSAVAERLGGGGGGERRGIEQSEGVVQGECVSVRSPWKAAGGGERDQFVGVGGGAKERMGMEPVRAGGEGSAMSMDETGWGMGWSDGGGASSSSMSMGTGIELMEQPEPWSAFV